jgi:hypothetical protein
MKKILKQMSLGAISIATVAGLSGSNMAFAAASPLQANLTQLNGSGASGTSSIESVGDNQVRVKVNSTGLSANLPHAQHLHIGGNNVCPTPDADKNNDGLIDTAEGQPSYGSIKVALTTTGDMGADSGLAVDRMPKADANGNVSYDRTFTLPNGVSGEDLQNAVVVQHGISKLFNDKAKYDGDKKSPLKEDLPLEATIPATCGKLVAAPSGSVDAGFKPADNIAAIVSVAAGVMGLGAAGVLVARRYN